MNIIQKDKPRNFEKELSLNYKLIEVQKLRGEDYYTGFLGLATVYYSMGDFEEAEKQILLYFEEMKIKGIKETADNSTAINIFLSKIQHNGLKFKEALDTLKKIERHADDFIAFTNNLENNPKSDLSEFDIKQMKTNALHMKENISINRHTNLWKNSLIEKLENLNNIIISSNVFEQFNGIRDYSRFANNLFLKHIELNNSFGQNPEYAFTYDYWGRSNYELLILAHRHFEYRDKYTLKVKVYNVEQIKNYLKVLPLYYDHIVFLWSGELITNNEGALNFFFVPSFYPEKSLGFTYSNIIDGHYEAMIFGHFNLLPQTIFDFILGEAKPLFELGYFTVIPALLGGYIDHNKQNLFDRLMDRALKPTSIINHGNIHSSQYLQLPYIQNITFTELLQILEEQKSDLRNLRKGIKNEQGSIQNGSIISENIKDSIDDFTEKIRKANRNYSIDFMPFGNDFIDLEKSLNVYVRDYLKKANEELGSTIEKMIKENPYSLFIKTMMLGKTWNINPNYLVEDVKTIKPSWINHWLQGTFESEDVNKH